MSVQDAELTALLILDGFTDYRKQFRAITLQAPGYFARADWDGVQCLAAERIDLYEDMIHRVAEKLAMMMADVLDSSTFWKNARQSYALLIENRDDGELGETFYNSVYCRLRHHRHINNQHMFIFSQAQTENAPLVPHIYRSYTLKQGVAGFIQQLLDDYNFVTPWENRRRDIRNILRYIRNNIPVDMVTGKNTVINVIRSVFYRNKAAYIVGRVNSGQQSMPFILPVLNNEQGGLYIDTVLTNENDVSIVFSFTRAYFMVEVDVPAAFIRFLHSLIPMKSIAELYNSIGFYKQGKAQFYRDFVAHLEQSDDLFEIAPGTPGMVMTVFTLPSYPVVFKIIKDRFSSSKQITREGVKEKYQLVKRHDRAGRMADTQEFVNLALPRARFSDELISELENVAGNSITKDTDQIIIHHLWTERRMIPLNIYLTEKLRENDEQALLLAVNEFGKCIKELAAANIFAGDMLFKNFGVTRHGRVVFYDYDEIMYLTDCNFRAIPEPLYPEQELAGEPWYSVAMNDVFPEEFTLLTACDRRIRTLFNQLHGELLEPAWWQKTQKRVAEGEMIDLYPYRKITRFSG